MTVRRLTQQDAPSLHALWAEGLRAVPEAFLLTEEELLAIPMDRFASSIPQRIWYGSFIGHKLVGYGCARRGGPKQLRHTADIGPVYVTASERGQGLGRQIMQALMLQLTDDGVLQVELTVDALNTNATALYTDLGFAPFGRRPRSFLIEGNPRTDI